MPTSVLMLVKCDREVRDGELRNLQLQLVNDLGLAADDFYVGGPLRKVTNADHEAIPSDDRNHHWLDVNLWRSYYGPGYERGDIGFFVKAAAWLERNLPDCEVYYGGDAAPNDLRLFDEAYRAELLESSSRTRE